MTKRHPAQAPGQPDAILREKQMKKWNRAWKIKLIEQGNPEWRDLYDDIAGVSTPPGFPHSRE